MAEPETVGSQRLVASGRRVVPWLLTWIAGTLAYWAATHLLGLDSSAQVLTHHWQYLDLGALAQSPWQSLWQLQSQPPLLNAITALLLQLPGASPYEWFIMLNAMLMAGTCLLAFGIGRQAGLPTWGAALSTLLFAVAPATLLNVAYPFYPAMTATLYAGLALSLLRASSSRQHMAGFAAMLTGLALLRTSFTPFHVIAFATAYILLAKAPRAALLWMLIASLALPTAWACKNLVNHGFFGLSSWSPANIVVALNLTGDDREFIAPAEALQVHPDWIQCEHQGTVDFELVKPTGGAPNYNSCVFRLHAQHLLATNKQHFSWRRYASRIQNNLLRYVSLPDTYVFLHREPIAPWAHWYNRAIFWTAEARVHLMQYSVQVQARMALIATLLVAALTACMKDLRPGRRRALLTLLTIIVAHMGFHVVTDGTESKRFVFDIEALGFVLAALCIQTWSELLGRTRPRAPWASSSTSST